MKFEWLHYTSKDRLIVFCAGWGMDATPFAPLRSENYDVLIGFDYSTEAKETDIRKLAACYQSIYLVSWSMGVVNGQKAFAESADHFERKIAINGTLQPVHDDFGIPVVTCLATLRNMGEETLVKFYRRMCRSSAVLEKFLHNRPNRSIESIQHELQVIVENAPNSVKGQSIYTDVVVATDDRIIPSDNQVRFWHDSKVLSLQGAHFPFYTWKSWDELMREVAQIWPENTIHD